MILGSTVTQHRLTGLLPMSKYTAKIQAARMGRYSAPISIEFNTGESHCCAVPGKIVGNLGP